MHTLFIRIVIKHAVKPRNPPLKSSRILDRVRERIRYLHCSLSTEKTYPHWARFFILWHGGTQQITHPRDREAKEVEVFLTMVATVRHVSVSTHNQALSALLFLYCEVLDVNLPRLTNINRPTRTQSIPSVLTQDEVVGVLTAMEGQTALKARLLDGTGTRLMEGMQLRIKDVDFDRHVIIVREAEGNKAPVAAPMIDSLTSSNGLITGAATFRVALPALLAKAIAVSASLVVDFNPVANRLRVITPSGANFRIAAVDVPAVGATPAVAAGTTVTDGSSRGRCGVHRAGRGLHQQLRRL